ncbi:MAG: OsmC family protein [Desulfobaccales bacterium]
MITCYSKKADFDTWFTNGKHEGHCDAPVEKGGGDSNFSPLELLEAALAGCLNIWLRKYAASKAIPLSGIMTEVAVDRQTPGEAVFQYTLELNGPLTEDQRRELIQAAQGCTVHQTLAGAISFKNVSS